MDELSWMGGLFDGEGCVGLYATSRGSGRQAQVRLVVTISNTKRIGLEPYVERFGGNIRWYPTSKPHYMRLYRWYVRGQRAYEFLTAILPYSKLKADEVTMAIQFWELPWRSRRGNQSRQKSDEQRAVDFDLARKVKALKRA